MGVLLILVIAATVYIAVKKNRNPILWLISGILLPPVAIIIILFLKPLENISEESEKETTTNEKYSMKNFDKFTINREWFKKYQSYFIVIIVTALFTVAGASYKMVQLAIAQELSGTNEATDEMIKLLLMQQLSGKELDLQVIAGVAELFHYRSGSSGWVLEGILIDLTIKNAILFGFIGLIMSLFFIFKEKININAKYTSRVVAMKAYILSNKKQILLSIGIVLLAGYAAGLTGYYGKQFFINNNSDGYYNNKFSKQIGEKNFAQMEPYVRSFLNSEHYIIDGTTLYEAELTRKKTKWLGYFLAVAFLFYRRKQKSAWKFDESNYKVSTPNSSS